MCVCVHTLLQSVEIVEMKQQQQMKIKPNQTEYLLIKSSFELHQLLTHHHLFKL